jgi:hypothetical protein
MRLSLLLLSLTRLLAQIFGLSAASVLNQSAKVGAR